MIQSIINAVQELKEEKVIRLVKYYIDNGANPISIIDSMQVGMNKVGELFQSEKYFLGDLMMAGIIFKEVLDLDEMNISTDDKNDEDKPLILIGTIKDDLHDIGKEIFSGMVSINGYKVIDLGVDVSPDVFLSNYYRYVPNIIGISGVLTQSIDKMKNAIDLFKNVGVRNDVKIIVGGHAMSKEVCQYIGADAYSKDVKQGIELCNQWIKSKDEVI